MHILIIPSWYPENREDAAGSFFREQAIALTKRGHKVGVISPRIFSIFNFVEFGSKNLGITHEDDEGVDTYRYKLPNFTPKISRLTSRQVLKMGVSLFKNYVKQHGKPDLIHVHSMLSAGVIALSIKNQYDIPYIVTEHSTAFARDLIEDKSLKSYFDVQEQSAANIAVSNEFKVLLSDLFCDERWAYLPNVVNESFLLHPLQGKSLSKYRFINVCFLDEKKRVDVLIRAFAKAFAGDSEVELAIGGDGKERSVLEALVVELGVDSQVEFLGALSRDEVKQEISRSNSFVLSSEYETFGVVLIEALALGKPVIATKCGGPESIVTPDVGFLVNRNNVEELADSMLKLYQKKEEFNESSIRNYCYENFSQDAVLSKLEQIYMNALAEKHSR